MKKFLEYSTNFILFLLGVMHTVLTLMNQRPFDLDALMYTGTGLAFIFVALFNFGRLKTSEPFIKLLCVVCNVLTTLYIVLIAAVFADTRVMVAVLVLLLLLILSIVDFRQSGRANYNI